MSADGTPKELIAAVERKWGKLTVDLAATDENTKAPLWITARENALIQDWTIAGLMFAPEQGREHPLLWLNPPPGDLTPWIRKCAEESQQGAHILCVAPMDLEQDWWWQWVFPYSEIHVLTPQLTYEGIPTTMAIYYFWRGARHSFWRWGRWNWKEQI